jgi:Cu2+-exporting ATPase
MGSSACFDIVRFDEAGVRFDDDAYWQVALMEHHGHAGPPGHGEHAGPGGHGDHAAQFRDRFWWSLVLSLPVVVYSEMVQEWLRFTPPQFPGSRWVAPVLGTAVFLYGGRPFLEGGLAELRSRQPGMMLLISLAILVAFGASVATVFGAFELEFWWELSLLIVIMLLGHWLEMRALGQASSALDALAALLPDEADLVTPEGTRSVPIADLAVGDVVLVRPGGRVPADGVVVEGAAELDESMITGESRPVPRGGGDRVVAGTVVTDSAVRVGVDAVGEETALAGIRRLVEQAQTSRSRAQALADRAAALLFWFALGAGILTLVVWLALGDPDQAIERTVTVLVIACPHALGLAIPLVIAISTGLAARNGILVKDRLALERTRTVDAFLFDKTGTLTTGRPRVSEVAAVDGDTDGLLRVAGAVEADSEHPLARAIVAEARERTGGELPEAGEFRAMTGRGVQARVEGATVAVGGPALLRQLAVAEPEELAAEVAGWRGRGATVLFVVGNDKVLGALALEDTVRPESGGDAHRRRPPGGRGRGRRPRGRRGAGRGSARGQGRGRGRPPAARAQGGHGRRRGQRRPRPGPGRRRHRHRRRHRRGHRVGRDRARRQRPPRRPRGSEVVPDQLPEDVAESCLGDRLQPAGRAGRRRRPGLGRRHPGPGCRRHPDEPVHHRRRPQRPAPAGSGPRAGERRPQ